MTDATMIPSGQRVPRDKIGDRKGHYPTPKRNPKQSTLNVTSQCLRHGKQGMSNINWEMFGAFGGKSTIEQGKRQRRRSKPTQRKMRLQNSPVPHTRELVGVHFDAKSGRFIRKDRYKPFSNK